MKTKLVLAVVSLAIVFFTSCSNDLLDNQSAVSESSLEVKSGIYDEDCDSSFITDPASLSADEIAGILLMREEEKMAHDVYIYFFEQYGVTVFDRIAASEASHTEAVGQLISYFGLTDPMLTDAGAFSNADIQNLYAELIAMGSVSVEAALATGAFIEEYDIADLQTILEGTDNADLQEVYTNLLEGSENHLRAFVRNLANYGTTYEPQILDAAYVAEILATANTGGQGGNGTGLGNGTGIGNGGQNQGNGQQGSGLGDGTGVDADGDGYCDATGEAVGTNANEGANAGVNGNKGQNTGNSGQRGNKTGENQGTGIDADGDGYCDVTGEPIGDTL